MPPMPFSENRLASVVETPTVPAALNGLGVASNHPQAATGPSAFASTNNVWGHGRVKRNGMRAGSQYNPSAARVPSTYKPSIARAPSSYKAPAVRDSTANGLDSQMNAMSLEPKKPVTSPNVLTLQWHQHRPTSLQAGESAGKL